MKKKLESFKKVLRECDYSNTYKMAWAKGIVELSGEYTYSLEKYVEIPLKQIAKKMFKYYWDQTIFFDLFQSSPNQPPVILSEVKKIINKYKEKVVDYKPIVFNRAEQFINENLLKDFEKSINKCVSNIKVNVMPFFLNLNYETYDFYIADKRNNVIKVKTIFLEMLSNNQQDLFDLINYRWSMMLENYNSSPRIAKKVRIMDEQEIRRSSLTQFDEFLDLENKEHKCFFCGKVIEDNDLSRDHVIPWSYLYSDDLWNLVYVHKGCNSSKNDKTPSEDAINKLKARNLVLKDKMHLCYDKDKKIVQELDYAIEKDFVSKFYLGCKGC